jgi:inorganic pyrophosphatase
LRQTTSASIRQLDKGTARLFSFRASAFFEEYKTLESKTVLVEDFQDENLAKEIIQAAISAYQKHFSQ